MSSGTHKHWFPRAGPHDATAARCLKEWLLSPRDKAFNGEDLDFRGSDLRGGKLGGAWLSGANFTEVCLSGSELHYGQLQRADFTRADLSAANLRKAELDYSNLAETKLSKANLWKSSLYQVDARGSDFSSANLFDAVLIKVDLRNANLSGANVDLAIFDVWLDESTQIADMRGSIHGPAYISDADGDRQLEGEHLATWLNSRGAEVVVLDSGSASERSSFTSKS